MDLPYQRGGSGRKRGSNRRHAQGKSHGSAMETSHSDSLQSRGIGRSDRGRSSQRVGQRKALPPAFILKIVGLEQEEETEFIAKVEVKLKEKLELKDTFFKDRILFLRFKFRNQFDRVFRLDGLLVANKPIEIKIYNPADQNEKDTEFLKDFVQRRYSKELEYLDLSNLNIKLTDKTVTELLKIISNYKTLKTISLQGNNLKSMKNWSKLNEMSIENVSLKDNDIQHYAALFDFNNLKELILIGNPITNKFEYSKNIKNIFPNLKLLDSVQFEEIEFKTTEIENLLPKTRLGFTDHKQTLQSTVEFLQNYYQLFDKNRKSLLEFYTDKSIFSVSIDSELKRSKGWDDFDRNLKTQKLNQQRHENLFIGGQKIVEAIQKLPGTTHPLNQSADEKLFLIDCFQQGIELLIGSGDSVFLYIFIHGYFVEKAKTGPEKKSFSRTFVLVPGGVHGVVVLNDTICIRDYSGNANWKNAVSLNEPLVQVTQNQPIQHPQLPNLETLQQYKLANQLVHEIN
jgi:nuclear RNA export factor